MLTFSMGVCGFDRASFVATRLINRMVCFMVSHPAVGEINFVVSDKDAGILQEAVTDCYDQSPLGPDHKWNCGEYAHRGRKVISPSSLKPDDIIVVAGETPVFERVISYVRDKHISDQGELHTRPVDPMAAHNIICRIVTDDQNVMVLADE